MNGWIAELLHGWLACSLVVDSWTGLLGWIGIRIRCRRRRHEPQQHHTPHQQHTNKQRTPTHPSPSPSSSPCLPFRSFVWYVSLEVKEWRECEGRSSMSSVESGGVGTWRCSDRENRSQGWID